MRVQTAHTRIDQIAIFVIALLCYAWFFPRWADPNQNSRLNMVVAVVDDGTFMIDKYVANTVDYAKVNGHYYSDKAPGTAFLGIPIYAGLRVVLDLPVLDSLTDRLANSAAFRATLRDEGSGVLKDKVRFAIAQIVLSFITNAVPTALMCALLYALLLQWGASRGAGIFTALAYGLLTPAFAYANSFYGHQLSAALLFIAFYLLHQLNRPEAAPSWFRLLGVGLLLGYSVITEYPTLLIAMALLIYAFFVLRRRGEWRRSAFMLIGLAACAAVLLTYNTVVFGGPFKLGYGNSELWTSQHSAGFMSLTYPHIDAVWGITFGLFRGLFVLSPVLLLALPGFVMWHRSRKFRAEFFVALFSVLAMFLFNASSIMWWGGFAIGPRYLLPGLPFMALGIAFAIDPAIRGAENQRRSAWLTLAVVLLSAGSLVATWGMTLAEQAFPSDAIRDNPYLQFALPNWLAGNIARNLGTIVGFQGLAGLLPLLAALAGVVILWGWLARRASLQTAIASKPATPFIANQSVESV